MALRDIGYFCPRGTQIRSPGGLSFDPADVAAIEAKEGRADAYLLLRFKDGGSCRIEFFDNTDGSPPDVYRIKQNIYLEASTKERDIASAAIGDKRVDAMTEWTHQRFREAAEEALVLAEGAENARWAVNWADVGVVDVYRREDERGETSWLIEIAEANSQELASFVYSHIAKQQPPSFEVRTEW